ncbi:MAG: transglycosylase SLT domain-containing protein [Fervidobacterium sp.]
MNIKYKLILIIFIFLITNITHMFADVPDWFSAVVKQRRSGAKEKTTQEFIEELWETIYSISNKYEIDPIFITTVIAIESNFTNVKGPGGVLGMMQILPSTAKNIAKLLDLKVPENWDLLLTDYKLNITYGTAYLSYLYKKTGSLTKALELYNNGKNRTTYAQTVMKQYEYYKSLNEKELRYKQEVFGNQNNNQSYFGLLQNDTSTSSQ